MSRSRLAFCFLLVPSIFAQRVTIFPRQNLSAVGAVLSTTTSSFNWWPYPAGGVTTSTSTSSPVPVPTLVPMIFTSIPTSSAGTSTFPSTPNSSTTSTSHSSTESPLHVHTTTSSSSSIPSPSLSPSLSPDPQSLLRASFTRTPFWLIPVCSLFGAVIGCAGGWLAWRYCGQKRFKNKTASMDQHTPDRYPWAYKYETEPNHDQHDYDSDDAKDVEHGGGNGHEYLPVGKGAVYHVHVEQGNRRVPSTASTSGARTWVGHPQPQVRKRSGAVFGDEARTITDYENEHNHQHENTNIVDIRSPLLHHAQSYASPSQVQVGVIHDSKTLPASPLPSPHSYGDDEGDDIPCETIRHKSIRRRIWERLGFAESDLGRKDNKVHEGEGGGRHTWSAGATQEHGPDLGRSLSFWGRRKTMKEGRVERWVRSVRGAEGGDILPKPADQNGPLMEPMECGETSPQLGTPELVLSTLRRVSPSTLAWRSQEDLEDGDLATALVAHPSTPWSTGLRHSRTVRRDDVEQRGRGVSLQDPGPVSGSRSVFVTQGTASIINTSSTSKDAFLLRPATASRSPPQSQRGGSPTPTITPASPSSVSRYSATPHVPLSSTLHRSTTRTPTRSTGFRDLRATTLTRAKPSARLARPDAVSNSVTTALTTRDSGSGAPPRNRSLPSHGVPQSQQHFTSELPVGPPSLTSPPLQSALCFDDTPVSRTGVPSRPQASMGLSTDLVEAKHLLKSTSSRVHACSRSVKRISAYTSAPPSAPEATAAAKTSLFGATTPPAVPVSVDPPRPLSPRERYLARQNANAQVGLILSRSYSSRNFDERPVNPTRFGAVIDEESQSSHHGQEGDCQALIFRAEDGEGIQQRLDRLRTLKR